MLNFKKRFYLGADDIQYLYVLQTEFRQSDIKITDCWNENIGVNAEIATLCYTVNVSFTNLPPSLSLSSHVPITA